MSLRTWGVVMSGALLLAGCGGSGAVELPAAPTLSNADAAACTTFLGDLPAVLAGEDSRPTEPVDALGAAWGDPAIVVTCGGDLPEEFDEFSSCEEANGVGWFVPPDQIADQSGDVTLTAAGYQPVVTVRLPGSYRPEGAAAVIVELGGPVKRNLELVNACG